MTFLIVRKPFGTKDQEFFGMAKGTEILSFSTQRPHKGETKEKEKYYKWHLG